MKKFTGEVAVVTGAARGLGREIAHQLAAEGAKVVVTDINEAGVNDTVQSIHQLHPESAIGIVMDVSDPESVAVAARQVENQFKRVDILINNAALLRYKPIFELTIEEWKKMMDINLNGYFYCSKEFAKIMARANKGKIINVSSISSQLGVAGAAAYCASKGGVNGLTKALAIDLAPYNITVNAVAPGPIEGELMNSISTEEGIKERSGRALFKRLATYEEIAGPVLFLASKESNWMTGTVVTVDGGFSAVAAGSAPKS